MVGVFGVLTNGTGGLLQNNLSDAFAVPQYVTQNAQILSKQIAVCMVAVAEPGMQSSPSGGAVSFQARALNMTSVKSKKANLCKPSNHAKTWKHACEARCKRIAKDDLDYLNQADDVLLLSCLDDPLRCIIMLAILTILKDQLGKDLPRCLTNCFNCYLADIGHGPMPGTSPCIRKWTDGRFFLLISW